MRFHYFKLFVAIFLSIKLLYIFIPIIALNYINYKIEKKIIAYIFTLFIFSESLFAGNIFVFKDFYKIKINIEKTNIYLRNLFIIWWKNQKFKI